MFSNKVESSEPSPDFNNLVHDMANLMTFRDKIVCTVNIRKFRKKLERKSRFLGGSINPSSKNILNMAFADIYGSNIHRSIKSYKLLTNRTTKRTTRREPILLSQGIEGNTLNSFFNQSNIDNENILDPQGSPLIQKQIFVKPILDKENKDKD